MTAQKTKTGAQTLHRRFLPERQARRSGGVPPLLGTMMMIAAVEFGVSRQGTAYQDPVSFSWLFSALAARHEAVDAEILCLGDSLAKHGFVPAIIEHKTGRKTYNLAVAAGPAPVTEILFRRALDAGARPSAIVFDMKPGLLAGSPRYWVREWQEFLSPGDLMGFLFSGHSGEFAAELAIGYVLPSFRARHEVRAAVMEALRGEPSRMAALNAILKRNWTLNAGANLARPSGTFHGEVTEAQHESHLSSKFAAQSFNAAAARRLVKLAAERGVRAYLVIPPLAPALLERQRTSGVSTKYENFLNTLQAVNPELTVVDARPAGFPAEVFIDPIHLDARGAVALSTQVAAFLRDDLSSESRPTKRWVSLPMYHEIAMPEDLENAEQSRERLGIPVQH